ncbi:MAG: hypothetical protein FJ020_01625 [Chloroflexi bacterium]|nr:hypothetical protein [Chloroflexota bacterium]
MANLTDKDDEMLIISKDLIQSLRSRLLDPKQAGQCRRELEKMLSIKEVLSWRADAGPCCLSRSMSAPLFGEVHLLEATLEAFRRGDYPGAASSLEEFARQAERNGTL